jgi:BlaI family transcriptional regulator, penicillinase repressor
MPPSDRRPAVQRASKDPIAGELGAAQAEIMNVVWETQGATVPEIHAAINRKRKSEAAYTTVLTLVQRLYARDLLVREPEGRTFRYRAAQSRDQLIATWSDEMIDRLIDDYGEIAIARLDDRLQALDTERQEKLRALRRKR